MACDHNNGRRHHHTLCLITGPSGCGKSSIAKKLAEELKGDNNNNNNTTRHYQINNNVVVVKLFHQDHYFIKPFLPYNERKDDSYENDSGIDWSCLIQDIITTSSFAATTTATTPNNNEVSSSTSSNNNSGNNNNNNDESRRRISSSTHNSNIFEPTDFIAIVEGHLLGAAINKFYDMATSCNNFNTIIMACLITCQKETCKHRRLTRRERNDLENNELSNYFDQYVWPSYINKYGRNAMNSIRRKLRTAAVNNDDNNQNNKKEIRMIIIEIGTDTMTLNESVNTIITKINME